MAAQPMDNRKEKLHELINRGLDEYHIEFRGNTRSNHILHGLVALWKLGADNARLEEYFKLYAKDRLEPVVPKTENLVVKPDNWRTWFGKKQHYMNYLEFFENEIKTTSVQQTIRTYLPQLAPSAPAAAFHCLIQLGYAIEAGSLRGIASGLAYFAYAYHDFGSLSPPHEAKGEGEGEGSKLSFMEILESVRKDQAFDDVKELRQVGFQSSMYFLTAYKKDRLVRYAHMWHCDIDKAEMVEEHYLSLWKAAVTLYHNSGNNDFFLLHTVTALHALKYILRVFPDTDAETLSLKQTLLRYYFLGAMYAYISEGRPPLNRKVDTIECATRSDLSWADIAKRTIPHEDVHVLKIVAACKEADEEERARDGRIDDPSGIVPPSMQVQAAECTLEKVRSDEDWEFDGYFE